jgi:hypothetical protein
MFGIICKDSVEEVGHSLFRNFRLALNNYLHEELKDIDSVESLDAISTLLIVDEHYAPHKEIWCRDTFVDRVNSNNIKVIIFNFEKIFNSQFPWNADIQRNVEKFNNRFQLVSDVKDAELLGSSIINKQLLSKSTTLIEPSSSKKNEILFIGQINEFYPTRGQLLDELQKTRESVNVIRTDRKYSYNEFLNLLNGSKYILNPLGTGEFINLRFYEALNLGCIVVQQYTEDMLKWYPELNQPNVLKFKNTNDFTDIDFNSVAECDELFLEDYFEEIMLKDILNSI